MALFVLHVGDKVSMIVELANLITVVNVTVPRFHMDSAIPIL
jgi:hypothetical protein